MYMGPAGLFAISIFEVFRHCRAPVLERLSCSSAPVKYGVWNPLMPSWPPRVQRNVWATWRSAGCRRPEQHRNRTEVFVFKGDQFLYYGRDFLYYGEDFLYYGEAFLYYGEGFLYYGEDFLY